VNCITRDTWSCENIVTARADLTSYEVTHVKLQVSQLKLQRSDVRRLADQKAFKSRNAIGSL
jgi:hypothetical protein